MEKQTVGQVVSVSRQWWLKINTKPIRLNSRDGAVFPHVIKVKYTVDGKDYYKRKWIPAGNSVPAVESSVTVIYRTEKPSAARIL